LFHHRCVAPDGLRRTKALDFAAQFDDATQELGERELQGW
jgi:hypothetical protein